MSNAKDRAAQIRRRDLPPPPEPVEEKPRPPARTRPVRQTVDITPARHEELAAWRLETALALGRTRMTTQDVLAAVIEVLLEDEVVARRVRAKLEE